MEVTHMANAINVLIASILAAVETAVTQIQKEAEEARNLVIKPVIGLPIETPEVPEIPENPEPQSTEGFLVDILSEIPTPDDEEATQYTRTVEAQVRPDGGALHFQIRQKGTETGYVKEMIPADEEILSQVGEYIQHNTGTDKVSNSMYGSETLYARVSVEGDRAILPTGEYVTLYRSYS
jgi:hypothetical protein